VFLQQTGDPVGLQPMKIMVFDHGRLWAAPNDGPGATWVLWAEISSERKVSGTCQTLSGLCAMTEVAVAEPIR
jgi:hypothetical protein